MDFWIKDVEHWRCWTDYAQQRGYHRWKRCAQTSHGDRRRNLRDIASEVGTSCGALQWILSKILGMYKVSARWVPRMLTEDQREVGSIFLGISCNCHEDDPEEYMGLVLTLGETWDHHFDPESKNQSMQG